MKAYIFRNDNVEYAAGWNENERKKRKLDREFIVKARIRIGKCRIVCALPFISYIFFS